MSDSAALRNKMYLEFNHLRMDHRITMREYEIFKRVADAGIKTLFSIKSDSKRMEGQ